MAVETLIVGQLQTNCYLFYDKDMREAFIIDPGDDGEFIINKIKDLNLKPKAILATHGHFDHVLAVTELKLAFNIPFYLNEKDIKILKRAQTTAKYFTGLDVDPTPTVDNFLINNKILTIGNLGLQVLVTPGHTLGSVCLYCEKEKLIFSGDLIFKDGGFGRTDLEGGNFSVLKQSIKKILSLNKYTIIYPGHGLKTSIENERNFWGFSAA